MRGQEQRQEAEREFVRSEFQQYVFVGDAGRDIGRGRSRDVLWVSDEPVGWSLINSVTVNPQGIYNEIGPWEHKSNSAASKVLQQSGGYEADAQWVSN